MYDISSTIIVMLYNLDFIPYVFFYSTTFTSVDIRIYQDIIYAWNYLLLLWFDIAPLGAFKTTGG